MQTDAPAADAAKLSNSTNPNSKTSSKKKWLIFALVLIGFIIVISLLKAFKPTLPTPVIEEVLPTVNTQVISPSTHTIVLNSIGQVTTNQLSQLSARTPAQVQSVKVQPGSKFAQGDLLVQMSPADHARLEQQRQAQLDQNNALLRLETSQHTANQKLLEQDKALQSITEANVKRFETLVKQKLINQSQLDQAREAAYRQTTSLIQKQTAVDSWPDRKAQLEAQVSAAQANLEQSQADGQTLNLKAPFAGYVAEVLTAPGAEVAIGTPLLSIYADDSLFVVANIPGDTNQQLLRIQATPKKIKAKGKLWGQTLNFQLTHIGQSQAAGGASLAYFQLTNTELFLPLNRAIALEIQLPAIENTYSVPATAVHQQEYIYLVAQDNTLSRQAITLLGNAVNSNEDTNTNNTMYKVMRISAQSNQAIQSQSLEIVTTQMVADVNGMKVKPINNTKTNAKADANDK